MWFGVEIPVGIELGLDCCSGWWIESVFNSAVGLGSLEWVRCVSVVGMCP
jgi:hypothetical protein